MTRAYRLGKRAEGVAATRRRIVETAREVVLTRGVADTSIVEISKRSGVTRPTVYQHFHTREEIILTVFETELRKLELQAITRALKKEDPFQALIALLHAQFKVWAGHTSLFQQMRGFAVTEGQRPDLDIEMEAVRERQITDLVERLGQAGKLRNGVSQTEAADMVLLLTSFETFEQMQRQGVPAIVMTLTNLVESAVLNKTE